MKLLQRLLSSCWLVYVHIGSTQGYVLFDKINSDNLYCLIAQAITLANAHDLNVRAVTCDGTTTNFSALKKLVAKLGDSLDSIVFTFGNEQIYFTSYAAHYA